MKRVQHIILAGMASVLLPAGLLAQTQPQDSTLSRTVVVEQEYNPDIMDAAKINVVPQVEPPVATQSAVEYDSRLVPAQNIPAATMQAYRGKEAFQKALPGYVRVGYGNYGNLDVRANYLFNLTNRDKLNLTFTMDGMDGSLDLPANAGKWDSYYYRTHAGIDYRHAFSKMDMNVAGHFDLSNFNFLPGSADGKQKFTAGDVHLGFLSTDEDLPLQFRAETNLLLYERQHELDWTNAREVIVRTKADVTGALADNQSVGVALGMDNAFYTNSLFKNYTSLELNPYYQLKSDAWNLRLGAHVDLAFGFGKQFRVSPDVSVDYNFAEDFVLYLRAKGGRFQNDFRRLETITPYGQLIGQPDATYEQLNATLGLKAGFLPGIRFNLYGGYQNLKNDLYATNMPVSNGQILALSGWNTDNLYAGAEFSYDYKDLLILSAYGIYRKWTASDNGENLGVLAYKPVAEGNVQLEVHPLQPLRVQVGFLNISRGSYAGTKVDPVSNLYLGGSYEIFKGISAYVRANNLLNKNYQYYWGYPAEGISFVGGVSFRF